MMTRLTRERSAVALDDNDDNNDDDGGDDDNNDDDATMVPQTVPDDQATMRMCGEGRDRQGVGRAPRRTPSEQHVCPRVVGR
jgi:hypothetical protein